MEKLFTLPAKSANGKKHYDVNMGTLIANYMADDKVHKIDAQMFRGLDNTKDPDMRNFLDVSDFKTERKKAGRRVSLNGDVAITVIKVDNIDYLSFFDIVSAKGIRRKLDEVIVYTNMTETWKGTDLPVFYRWFRNEDGLIERESYYWQNKSKTILPQGKFVYPKTIKYCPVGIIRNNAESMPDWVKAGDILREIDVLSNDLGIEWEKIKTQYQNTAMFQNGKKGNEIAKEIENGKWMHDAFSTNSKFAQSLQAIISGSQTATMLVQQIIFMEDRAMKYAFQGRDMDSSGTNKHNMQVGLFNQAHGEYNQVRKEQLEDDYLWAFKNVVEPLTGIKAPTSITIDSSIFEQGKIEGMRAAAEQNQLFRAQASNQKAQAKQKNTEAQAQADAGATIVTQTTLVDTNTQP